MTDHLLLEYFKNYKGDNSDLFEGSQMERTLISYTGSKARLAYTGAFASLFSFLLLSKAKAQVNVSEMDKVSRRCSEVQVLQEK